MNTISPVVPEQFRKLSPDDFSKQREKLAEEYQKAFLAENEERLSTNLQIARLRKAERRLRDASKDFAEMDQYRFHFMREVSFTRPS